MKSCYDYIKEILIVFIMALGKLEFKVTTPPLTDLVIVINFIDTCTIK